MTKIPRRTFLEWLFRTGAGQPIINVWVEQSYYGGCQRITTHKLKLGRYTVLRWGKVVTSVDLFQ